MREIKFRAWAKKEKEIIVLESIDFKKKLINMSGAWRMFKEVELMQYTGLKDKNGVEIYEGDIVKWVDAHLQGFEYHGEVVRYCGGGFVPFSVPHWEVTPYSEDVEVIGNIHENPELLEELDE